MAPALRILAAAAAACAIAPAGAATAAAPAECPGDPIAPTQVITGEFDHELQGGYVLVPFDVPPGTTAVRVKYCHDQPELPTSAEIRHTLDLGLYEARTDGGTPHGPSEFRGWGGSSHPDVTVSAEGFSSEEQYRADPRAHVPGKTTRAFLPGPVEAGEWAAELGVAAVADETEGDLDGRVAWRLEIELSADPAFADEPYAPAPYDTRPARSEPGWYAGDLHVHAEHSALGDATMTEVFDYAFGPAGPSGAGLDFITLSDYVSGGAWGEIGRHQPRYPGKLIVRSAEIITYRGHTNSHANTRHLDYRTGPVYERRQDGSIVERRAARAPAGIFDDAHAAGGFTQVNHPTIFPSEVPLFQFLCRGCPWDYTDAETRWEKVDAYEVHTGPAGLAQPQGNEPGPNPFTLTAIDEYDRLRRAGHWLAAVAVSDSHNAGRTNNPVTQSPIGEGTTVVYADELSERGVRRAVEAGHTYVKLFGADSPDLRLTATAGGLRAIPGDGVPGTRAEFEARVIGGVATPQPRQLVVLRDGSPVETVPVTGADFTHRFSASERGDYRIQLMRGTAIDGLTTPIRLGDVHPPLRSEGRAAQRLRLSVRPRRTRTGRRTRFRFRVTDAAGTPVPRARIRFAGRRARTGTRGRARIVKRFRRPGVRRARAARAGWRRATARVRVRAARRSGPRFTG